MPLIFALFLFLYNTFIAIHDYIMGNVWKMQTPKPESLEDYQEDNSELEDSFISDDEMFESDSVGSVSNELLDVDNPRNYAGFEYDYHAYQGM